jgi:hypothetical protein
MKTYDFVESKRQKTITEDVVIGNTTAAIRNYQKNRNYYFIPYKYDRLTDDKTICSVTINDIFQKKVRRDRINFIYGNYEELLQIFKEKEKN